jgi:hypothetical protein
VLEILSLLLLRLRDGKTRGTRRQGVLIKLVNGQMQHPSTALMAGK